MTASVPTAALTLATCQAHNTVPISRALAAYLSERLAIPVAFAGDADWQACFRGIAGGDIALGWICGRPYTRLVDAAAGPADAPIRLLAAPVMAGARYGGRPVYFSDVVVRADSPFRRFDDLRGASWAYNEPGSQSGYTITQYRLATMGEGGDFFGRVVASGAHVRSLAMVLSGEVDASAIDSTVLEWELARDPELGRRLRVIDTFGPSPIPPLVASARLDPALFAAIRGLLLSLHETAEGRAILEIGRLSRFAAVTDGDYDAIRDMAEICAGVIL